MTGNMLQLDVAIAKLTAATPQTLLRYLETAREMVRYSRSELDCMDQSPTSRELRDSA